MSSRPPTAPPIMSPSDREKVELECPLAIIPGPLRVFVVVSKLLNVGAPSIAGVEVVICLTDIRGAVLVCGVQHCQAGFWRH